MKLSFHIRKKHFVYTFFGVTLFLFLLRLSFPSVRRGGERVATQAEIASDAKNVKPEESLLSEQIEGRIKKGGERRKHRIYGVASYALCFPDVNDVQLPSARRHGIRPLRDRETMNGEGDALVCVALSPYYKVRGLRHSVPYLVPRAALLLETIGRNFLDSQYVKGVAHPEKLVVTSLTRTLQDVASLRRINGNASENSCHLYGTTFDISYNKFCPIHLQTDAALVETRSDTLKYILSEVLRDLRSRERCYVKYEVKQGCFHITVR